MSASETHPSNVRGSLPAGWKRCAYCGTTSTKTETHGSAERCIDRAWCDERVGRIRVSQEHGHDLEVP